MQVKKKPQCSGEKNPKGASEREAYKEKNKPNSRF